MPQDTPLHGATDDHGEAVDFTLPLSGQRRPWGPRFQCALKRACKGGEFFSSDIVSQICAYDNRLATLRFKEFDTTKTSMQRASRDLAVLCMLDTIENIHVTDDHRPRGLEFMARKKITPRFLEASSTRSH